MPSPPVFQRPPRLIAQLPTAEVEVPLPPPAPAMPTLMPMDILLPVAGGLLTGFLLSFLRTGRSNPWTFAAYSLVTALVGGGVQVARHLVQRSRVEQARQVREEKYAGLLQGIRTELETLSQAQRDALLQVNPAPGDCLKRVMQMDARMWERSLTDRDFLSLRVGLGEVPASFSVELARTQQALDPDPLEQTAAGMVAEFANVSGSPIAVNLREAGVVGVSGPRSDGLQLVRSLIMQLATHHSPDEVKLVLLLPSAEMGEWAWLRWLPHVWSDDRRQRYLMADKESAHIQLSSTYELLQRRRLQSGRRTGTESPWHPHLIFVVADPGLAENHVIMPLILRENQAVGASAIFLTDRTEALPKECRDIIEVKGWEGRLIQREPAVSRTAFAPDPASVEAAEGLARSMAPVQLHRLAQPGELPGAVPLLSLLGVKRLEDVRVPEQWADNLAAASLAAPLGVRAGGDLVLLDLHERGHGPHGLVAGATGSGKSELLQTFIASIAWHYHPHDVAFLLVDYKGGGMANDFRDLPHLVGTITNLEGSLAQRALASIHAELRRRQRLLADAGVKSIGEYLKLRRLGGSFPPMPHLVVVVDEFAELKMQQPEFMRQLVSAVRVGRSLGVHLVLATQKPSGVVDEQIWSNARFRICLRVERPEDSQEVLKSPAAADITRAGRAYFQVGNQEVFELFQAGWGGAPYTPEGESASIDAEIFEVALDGFRYPLGGRVSGEEGGSAQTQLQALISHIAAEASLAGIERLPGPWLPPLPAQLTLDIVRPDSGWNGRNWRPVARRLEPVVGLLDCPEEQAQPPMQIALGREGHLIVYGASGMGKTTFLQTLLVSLAADHSPDELHMYLIDCGSRSLGLFRSFPHVGAVIFADEEERLSRLMRYLREELDRRKEMLAAAGVSTLGDYRRTVDGAALASIVVVVDNYPEMVSNYPGAEEQLPKIAREGAGFGLHLILTANSCQLVRTKVSTNFALAVALHMTDRADYAMAVARPGQLEPAAIPGRGLVKVTGASALEFQTALCASGETEFERATAIRRLAEAMDAAWNGRRARPIRAMPDIVTVTEVWRDWAGQSALTVPLGLETESMEPLAVDLSDGPHFIVAGGIESGKTTLLRTWLLGLAEHAPVDDLHIYLVDFRSGGLHGLRRLPHVRSYITTPEGAAEMIAEMTQVLQARRDSVRAARQQEDLDATLQMRPSILIVIDDYDAFRSATQGGARDQNTPRDLLEQVVRRDRGLGVHVIAAGAAGDFASGLDGFAKALKELQTGFLLGSSDPSDLQVLGLRLPSGEAAKPVPPGTGLYARRGRFRKLRVAQSGPERV